MHPMRRSHFLSCLLAGCALAASAAPVAAQTAVFPDRPLKLVIPFAAGGATDVLGRMLAVALGEKLGQPMVVENKPGAGTILAASQVAKAPPAAKGITSLSGRSGNTAGWAATGAADAASAQPASRQERKWERRMGCMEN